MEKKKKWEFEKTEIKEEIEKQKGNIHSGEGTSKKNGIARGKDLKGVGCLKKRGTRGPIDKSRKRSKTGKKGRGIPPTAKRKKKRKKTEKNCDINFQTRKQKI